MQAHTSIHHRERQVPPIQLSYLFQIILANWNLEYRERSHSPKHILFCFPVSPLCYCFHLNPTFLIIYVYELIGMYSHVWAQGECVYICV